MDPSLTSHPEQPKREYAVISMNELNNKACMAWNGGTYHTTYEAILQISRMFKAEEIPTSITVGGLGVSLRQEELPKAASILAEFGLTLQHLNFSGVTFMQAFIDEVMEQKTRFGSADLTDEGIAMIRAKVEGATKRINPSSN